MQLSWLLVRDERGGSGKCQSKVRRGVVEARPLDEVARSLAVSDNKMVLMSCSPWWLGSAVYGKVPWAAVSLLGNCRW